ncbi:hypothetical protein GC207_01245 [bacterium]|nr:hypothetical protein [bacterium]
MNEHKDEIRVPVSKRVICWMLGLCAALLRLGRRIKYRRIAIGSPSRVLVIEPFGMGDIITLEPLVRNIILAGYQVQFSGQNRWQRLLAAHSLSGWTASEVPWSGYKSREKTRISRWFNLAFWRFVDELRRVGCGSIGIDPRGDIRSVILLYLAGCRDVVSLSQYLGSNLKVATYAASVVPFRHGLPRWEVALDLLQPLGVPVLDHSPPQIQSAATLQPEDFARSRRIGIVPIAPWRGKYWEASKWAKLTTWLRENGNEPVALCGPGQTAEVEKETLKLISIIECESIDDWLTAMKQLEGLVSLDTGPMHLADALGVPVVALFGQGLLPLWAPSGPRSRVVSHQQDPGFQICHPTDKNTHLGTRWMKKITVEEVIKALRIVGNCGVEE